VSVNTVDINNIGEKLGDRLTKTMNLEAKNPWRNFEASDQMVHENDRASVESHNSKVEPKYRFLLQLAPEPWIGSIDAPIIILYANPGATPANLLGEKEPNRKILELSLQNLRQEFSEFPHFFFNPTLKSEPGGRWFRKRFRELIEATSLERVAQSIATVEAAPYHSVNWKSPKTPIPTQEFTNDIVRNAIAKGALILRARHVKGWVKAVPELSQYANVIYPSSAQCAYVSANNYKGTFERIVEAIR
jgi:hypothetical protein